MARVVLGVTGSVAATRTPLLCQGLTQRGYQVRVVVTEHAEYFFDARSQPVEAVLRDADEWPRRHLESTGGLRSPPLAAHYQPGDPVLHIELRRWGDLLVVAPLDAHTLAKFALGLCDNLLTCLYRAWDRQRPILLAPAMNTFMWEHPATLRHLQLLLADHSPGHLGELTPTVPGHTPPAGATPGLVRPEEIVDIINRSCPRLRIVGPIAKRLACGDEGVGGMAEVADLLQAVEALLPFTD